MDRLFLLKPDFTDNNILPEGQKYYCPYCAKIEGVLAYYPHLRKSIEVNYVAFEKPRQAILELIGAAHQSCPVLILGVSHPIPKGTKGLQMFNGNAFISSDEHILQYLAARYQVGLPHP